MKKNFKIFCSTCKFSRLSTGLSDDLSDLKEIKSCLKCGKNKKFYCPNCNGRATLIRISGNS